MPSNTKIIPFYKFNLIKEDPDDNKFVNCTIASNALYLVSNDNDFKILTTIEFPKVSWLSLQKFEDLFKEKLSK